MFVLVRADSRNKASRINLIYYFPFTRLLPIAFISAPGRRSTKLPKRRLPTSHSYPIRSLPGARDNFVSDHGRNLHCQTTASGTLVPSTSCRTQWWMSSPAFRCSRPRLIWLISTIDALRNFSHHQIEQFSSLATSTSNNAPWLPTRQPTPATIELWRTAGLQHGDDGGNVPRFYKLEFPKFDGKDDSLKTIASSSSRAKRPTTVTVSGWQLTISSVRRKTGTSTTSSSRDRRIGTRSRSSVMVNSVLPYAIILSVRSGVCCKPPRWRCTNPNFSRLPAASLNHLPIASRLSSPRPGSATTSLSTTSSKSPIFKRPRVLLVHECKVVKHDGQAQGPQLSPTSATWRYSSHLPPTDVARQKP